MLPAFLSQDKIVWGSHLRMVQTLLPKSSLRSATTALTARIPQTVDRLLLNIYQVPADLQTTGLALHP